MVALKKSDTKAKKVAVVSVKDAGKVERPKRTRNRPKSPKKIKNKLPKSPVEKIKPSVQSAPLISKESPLKSKNHGLVKSGNPKVRVPKNSKKTKREPHTLDSTQVTQAVSELLRLDEERKKSKKELFDTEGDAIFLTIASCRIANVPRRIVRFVLPHPLVQDTSDVALIVRDLQPRERKPDMEAVIQLHESRLFTEGITRPIKVIPIRQIMTENKTYESKRRLSEQFNMILADTHISSRLYTILGKNFSKKRLNPIPVKLDDPSQYKRVIERAICKTGMQISANGGTTTVQVGHTGQRPNDIAENILAVAKGLCVDFPGGWVNVRNLIIKTSHSVGIPIYVSIRDPSDIQLVGMGKQPKKNNKAVEGDLSTKMDTKVLVFPSGKVIGVQPKKNKLKKKMAKKMAKKTAKPKSQQKISKESEDELEMDTESEEETEEAYLDELSNSNKLNKKRSGKNSTRSSKRIKKV